MTFKYNEAFSRNLGFLSVAEQVNLKNACVAVAGLGGTGGAQVQALARMGIGNFVISDPDKFEVVNFNRQLNANMGTVGRNKTEVAKEVILGINPEAKVLSFPEGISELNILQFLTPAQVVVDSLDFYCFKERLMLYKAARHFGQWVFTSPPLGFGYTMLAFDPNGMKFEDYFGFEPDMDQKEMLTRFIAGLSPKEYMIKYLNRGDIDPSNGQLPSVGAAPFLVSGAIAAEVTSLLTGHEPDAAPFVYQFDAKLKKFYKGNYREKSIYNKIRRYFISRML